MTVSLSLPLSSKTICPLLLPLVLTADLFLKRLGPHAALHPRASEIPAYPMNAPSRSAWTAFRRLLLMWKPEKRGGSGQPRGPQGPANYLPLVHSVHMTPPPHYLVDTRRRKPYPRNQSKVKPPPPFLTVEGTPRPVPKRIPPLGVFFFFCHPEKRRLARPWAQLCRRCVKLTTGHVGPSAEERTEPNAIIVRPEISSGCADLLRIF